MFDFSTVFDHAAIMEQVTAGFALLNTNGLAVALINLTCGFGIWLVVKGLFDDEE